MTDEHRGPDGEPGQEQGDHITPVALMIQALAESARAFSLIPSPQAAALTQQCLDVAEMAFEKMMQEVAEAEDR
jgi:hypothetical protein